MPRSKIRETEQKPKPPIRTMAQLKRKLDREHFDSNHKSIPLTVTTPDGKYYHIDQVLKVSDGSAVITLVGSIPDPYEQKRKCR